MKRRGIFALRFCHWCTACGSRLKLSGRFPLSVTRTVKRCHVGATRLETCACFAGMRSPLAMRMCMALPFVFRFLHARSLIPGERAMVYGDNGRTSREAAKSLRCTMACRVACINDMPKPTRFGICATASVESCRRHLTSRLRFTLCCTLMTGFGVKLRGIKFPRGSVALRNGGRTWAMHGRSGREPPLAAVRSVRRSISVSRFRFPVSATLP